MNIVYIHQYYRFGPEGGPVRSWYISQALGKAGYKVTLLGSHMGRGVINRQDGFVRVVLFPVKYENSFGFIRRISSWIKFIWLCRQWLQHQHFDMAYLSSTPLTVALLAIHFKRKGIPYCFEIRDLWPEVPVWLGIVPPWIGRLTAKAMKLIYEKAFCVICLSKPVIEHLNHHYHLSKKPLLITNFSDQSYYQHQTRIAGDRLHLVYLGALGDSAGVDELLMLRQVIKSKGLNLHLHVAGQGKWQHKFDQKEKEPHFTFHGFLNREEVRVLLHQCHLGLVLFKPHKAFNYNSPNKYFDYLAAGLPIASNLKNSWYLKEAESQSCGFYLDFYDQEKLTIQLNSIIEKLRSDEVQKKALELSNKYLPELQLKALMEKLSKVYTWTPETSV